MHFKCLCSIWNISGEGVREGEFILIMSRMKVSSLARFVYVLNVERQKYISAFGFRY